MLALKHLFASPTRLVGQPNFEKAPWYYIDLSGIKVAYKNPAQTTAVPQKVWSNHINIYGDSLKAWSSGEGATACIFRNHWSYFGGYIGSHTGHVGALNVQLTLQRRLKASKEKPGLLENNEAKNWIWSIIQKDWDAYNKQQVEEYTDPINPPVLCCYPESPNHLKLHQFNGLEWMESKLYFGESEEVSGDRTYYLPITNDHVLLVWFTLSSYAPAVVKEAELTIKHFMENFHVKWSEG